MVVGLLRGARDACQIGVLVEVACRVRELAGGYANSSRAASVRCGSERGAVAGAAALQVGERAASDGDIGQAEISAGFAEREVDRLSAGNSACAGTSHRDGGRSHVGVVRKAGQVVAFLRGAADATQVSVFVRVAGCIGELARQHPHSSSAQGTCSGGKGSCVFGVTGGAVAAGSHRGEGAQSAACGVDVGQHEVAGGLAQGECDCLWARCNTAAVATDGDGGGAGVGHQGVVAERDLVVGLKACAAGVGVGVVVACSVCKLACRNTHGGRALGVGVGGEGGRVLRVAIGGVAAAGHRGKTTQGAACDVNVGLGESGACLRQGEVNRLAGVDHTCATAADHHRGGGGVGQLGVVDDVDEVVCLQARSRHAGEVGVQVGVVAGVGELARSHANGGGAQRVGVGREGSGVVGVAACSRAAGGHWGEVGQGATRDVHISQAESSGGLREHEGDGV